MPTLRPARWLAASLLACTFALGFACGGKTDDPSSSPDAGDAGRDCTPGDKKKWDCNSCVCDASGFWSCTTMACLDSGTDAGGKCTPGETMKLDCNTCTCMTNGEWACTGLACVDSGTDSGALDPKCPKTWAEASAKAYDELCPSIVCNYAEGSCNCPAYCGGPAPGPDWKPTWSCTPKPPPRTDGCPDVEPSVDGACTSEGKMCSYDRCCTYQYKCTKGKWTGGVPLCPP